MISEVIGYAANRVLGGAVDNAARKASWIGVAAFMLAVGMVFSLVVLFWLLDNRYSATTAGIVIACGCFLIGTVCLLMPRMLDGLEARSRQSEDPVVETASAVQEEVADAVDYFGPIRVVGSALLLGMGIARSVKAVVARN